MARATSTNRAGSGPITPPWIDTGTSGNKDLRWPEVLSLDVFDTALVRSCGSPQSLYLWLGRRLADRQAISCSAEVFARTRARVERYVWEREGWLDSQVLLQDFHHEVCANLGLSPHMVDTLVAEELRLEREVLRPNPWAHHIVERAHAAGSRVVFVSDTYFELNFVRSLLREHGLWTPRSRCYVSSELGQSKASGRLFHHVVRDLGVRADDVVHIGDNPVSDLRAARRSGVRAVHQREGELSRYEQILVDAAWGSDGLAAAMAGAARAARLDVPATDDHHRAIRQVAAGVGGPAVVGFVLWILHRAHALGLRRLYFLARDGQLMARVASTLALRLGFDIEARYLYVSRLSTNLAATFSASESEFGWLLRDRDELDLDELLQRLDLTRSDLADLPLGAPEGEASEGAVGALLDAVQAGPLRELTLERAHVRRERVLRYFEQEGLLDDLPFGLIDIGGVGSQIGSIHTLVEHAGGRGPHAFLVGLDAPEEAGLTRPVTEPAWLPKTECYIYDHRRRSGMQQFRGLVTCYQMFCAADHGTVLDYCNSNVGVVPDLSEHDATELSAWGLETLHRTIERFAEKVTLDEDVVAPWADVREAVCATIKMFWQEPVSAEAAAWGWFPFEGAEARSSSRPLATAYTCSKILRQLRAGSFPDLGWQHWHEGAVRSSNLPLRVSLQATEEAYKRLEASTPGTRRAASWIRSLLKAS